MESMSHTDGPLQCLLGASNQTEEFHMQPHSTPSNNPLSSMWPSTPMRTHMVQPNVSITSLPHPVPENSLFSPHSVLMASGLKNNNCFVFTLCKCIHVLKS